MSRSNRRARCRHIHCLVRHDNLLEIMCSERFFAVSGPAVSRGTGITPRLKWRPTCTSSMQRPYLLASAPLVWTGSGKGGGGRRLMRSGGAVSQLRQWAWPRAPAIVGGRGAVADSARGEGHCLGLELAQHVVFELTRAARAQLAVTRCTTASSRSGTQRMTAQSASRAPLTQVSLEQT